MTLDDIKEIIENNIPDSKAIVLDPMNDGERSRLYLRGARPL